MTSAGDVLIIGAGIVGSACALEAALSGLSVTVIEAGPVGGGATAAGMGHIVVMDDSEAQFALTRYSQRLWHELAEELPADAEYTACGTIWVAADDEEMAEVRRKVGYCTAHGIPVLELDAQALAQAEPHLRRGLAGGVLMPEDRVVYPPAVARYLLERSRAAGARVCVGQRALSIGARTVTLDDGTIFHAGSIVNATGTWAPQITPGLSSLINKRKGHLVITDRYPGFVRHQLVELGYLKSAHALTTDSVAFNVQPRPTGQVLIGSSRQYGVDDTGVDGRILARMLARARQYMPGLARLASIRTWTGFRAATPDKLPLIGPWPGQAGLYLATGHEGLGITTALGTAKLLVDQLLERTSAITPEPYLPARMWQAALSAGNHG